MNKTMFFSESITAALVKKRGNKDSLEKQVTVAVNWGNTLALAIHYRKNILIYTWLGNSISTWPTKRSVRDKITQAH